MIVYWSFLSWDVTILQYEHTNIARSCRKGRGSKNYELRMKSEGIKKKSKRKIERKCIEKQKKTMKKLSKRADESMSH
jgi:hypothetical protein